MNSDYKTNFNKIRSKFENSIETSKTGNFVGHEVKKTKEITPRIKALMEKFEPQSTTETKTQKSLQAHKVSKNIIQNFESNYKLERDKIEDKLRKERKNEGNIQAILEELDNKKNEIISNFKKSSFIGKPLEKTTHFHKKDKETSFVHSGIEQNEQGEIFVSLNIKIGEGASKVVKLSVKMSNLELRTRGVIKLQKLAKEAGTTLEGASDLTQKEFNIQKKLSTKYPQYFVNVDHLTSYTSKRGEKKLSFAMEYCNRGNLKDYLMNLKNKEHLLNIMEDILTSMKFMEEEQIHHRDMKPENIYLYTNEKSEVRAKIGDFGSAHEVSDEEQDLSLVGTPFYIAPYLYKADQFLKAHQEGPKAVEQLANSLKERLKTAEKNSKESSNKEQEMKFIEACKNSKDYCRKTLASTKSDLFAVGSILHEICSGNKTLKVYQNVRTLYDFFDIGMYGSHEKFIDDPFFKDPKQITPLSSFFKDPEQITLLRGFVEELLNFNPDDCPTAKECLEKFKEITGRQ